MFEDLKARELVYEQAQKNRRKLVKNDETITVGHDRQKLVKNDEREKTLGFVKVFVGKDQDIVVKQDGASASRATPCSRLGQAQPAGRRDRSRWW
jgi:type VI secretion system secreted protein VgrG